MDMKPTGEQAAAESEQLIEPARDLGAPKRRWLGRLALAAGVSACAGALAVLHVRYSAQMATLQKLRTPFKLYNTSMPGLLKMPDRADQYNGVEDKRPIQVNEKDDGIVNIFVLGDWGATLPNHQTFGAYGWDMWAQVDVANAIKNRAKWADPQYVLNVGDNFYVQGIVQSCQDPPSAVYGVATNAFSLGWQQVYGELAQKPWISTLGNHDYGGYRMDQGWPQQIAYSFVNYNWIMPARYYTKKVQHKDFVAEYFVFDSNANDAKYPGQNPDHNICSSHNYGGHGSCANNGGMPSIQGCRDWFWQTHHTQKAWVEKKLNESTARWKIVVTHFPCGYDTAWYKELKAKYGLDLLVTGHRHQQELWWPGTESKYLQKFLSSTNWDGDAPACFVTGGGGGISSQKFSYADYGKDLLWYGFFHLTMHKDWMNIELVGTDGIVAGNRTIWPSGSEGAKQQAKEMLKSGTAGICDSFCGDVNNPWDKVCGWMSCSSCDDCKRL